MSLESTDAKDKETQSRDPPFRDPRSIFFQLEDAGWFSPCLDCHNLDGLTLLHSTNSPSRHPAPTSSHPLSLPRRCTFLKVAEIHHDGKEDVGCCTTSLQAGFRGGPSAVYVRQTELILGAVRRKAVFESIEMEVERKAHHFTYNPINMLATFFFPSFLLSEVCSGFSHSTYSAAMLVRPVSASAKR